MFDDSAPLENRPSDQDLALRLMMLGLWKRRRVLLAAVVVSLGLAVVAARQLSTSRYAAEAPLLYDRVAFRQAWDREAPPMTVLASLAVSPPVVEAAARSAHTSRAALEAVAKAEPDRDGSQLLLSTEWSDPATAEQTSLALRSAFIDALRRNLDEERARTMKELEARLQRADAAVTDASARLRSFLSTNGVSIVDMTMGGSTSSLDQLRLAVTEAKSERAMIAQELEDVRATIPQLRTRVREEIAASQASQQASRDISRAQAVIAEIEARRDGQQAAVDLQYNEVALRRARYLTAQGYMSRQELDMAQQAYEKTRALLRDDSSYQKVHREVAAVSGVPSVRAMVPSETFLQQQEMQAHNLSRQLTLADSKLQRLQRQYAEARSRTLALPKLQSQYDVLAYRLQRLQSTRNELEGQLSRQRLVMADPTSDIPGVLASQGVQTRLVKSRGKMIAALVFGGGVTLAIVLLAFLDWRDRRVKAPAQLSRALALPVLGAVPQLTEDELAAGGALASADFREMMRRLRQLVPQRGARVMLVSLRHGEGKSLVAQGLARAAAASREDVLLLDAEVHHADRVSACGGTWVLPPSDVAVHDIRDYLAGRVQRPEEVLHPTTVANITCLPLLDRRGAGEMLESPRLRGLMEHVSRRHGLVLVEGAPLEETDHQQMWAHVDAVVVVVQSRVHAPKVLQAELRRFAEGDARVVGAIMTRVEPSWMIFDPSADEAPARAEEKAVQGVAT